MCLGIDQKNTAEEQSQRDQAVGGIFITYKGDQLEFWSL